MLLFVIFMNTFIILLDFEIVNSLTLMHRMPGHVLLLLYTQYTVYDSPFRIHTPYTVYDSPFRIHTPIHRSTRKNSWCRSVWHEIVSQLQNCILTPSARKRFCSGMAGLCS